MIRAIRFTDYEGAYGPGATRVALFGSAAGVDMLA